jgi:hypothetical protein
MEYTILELETAIVAIAHRLFASARNSGAACSRNRVRYIIEIPEGCLYLVTNQRHSLN